MDTQDLRDKHYTLVTDALIQTVPAHIKAGIDTRRNKERSHLGEVSQEAQDTENEVLWRHAAWLVYSHRSEVPDNLIGNLPHLSQHFEQLRKDGAVRRAIRNWYIDVEEERKSAEGLVNRGNPEITRRNAETYKGNVLAVDLMIETTPVSFSFAMEMIYKIVRWQSYITAADGGDKQ